MAIKLKVAAKKKWLEALRSSVFEQGQGDLRIMTDWEDEQYEYCCLGVANEVLALDSSWGLGTLATEKFASMCQKKTLPKNQHDAADRIGELQDKLAKMNDEDEKSFKQIANWIEKNL